MATPSTSSPVKYCPASPECVHKQFEAQARRTPDAIAVESSDAAWSYAALDAYANRLAHKLLSAGVTHGTMVGLCVPRSYEAIAALLGILKAGAAYVPFDLSYPVERLKFTLADTQLRCFIADESGWAKLNEILDASCAVVDVKDVSRTASEAPDLPCADSDLAYVMYTSGSSGVPKGVMIEHRGIVRLVTRPNYVDISAADVFLQLAPLSFDASTFEIWGALLNGARLAVMPSHTPSLAEISDALKHHRVTTLWLTAGLFNAMVDEYPSTLAHVKQLLAGGDVLSPAHVRKAMKAMQGGVVINGYGPTENTTFTCCHRIRLEDTNVTSVPIGTPINGTQVYILRPDLTPVTGSEVGEIYMGGRGLARGYWNRPELTAERFVKNPLLDRQSDLLYRSGDLGHYNARGEIEFDGRVDLQVKIRGFRIEIPEIEAALLEMPDVSSAAVVAKNAGADGKRLCCYFVAKAGDVTPAGLERFARLKLPEYMVPSEFVQLADLPLSENGKVDRNLLSTFEASRTAEVGKSESATGQLELELIGMWKSLLRLTDVGLDDDFFQLGGHSLVAARFFAQIHSRYGKKLPLATILQARTIRALAAMIRDDHWVAPWSSLVPLKTTGDHSPFFLVHAIGGNVLSYEDLACNLPAAQPLYALQAKGLDGESQAAASVEEMAAHYIRGIRTVQPEGPYYLGGFSAGGVVALEMARQLQNAGSFVGLLAIFDSSIEPAVGSLLLKHRVVESARRLTRIVRWNLHYLEQTGPVDFAQKKIRNLGMNLRIGIFEVHDFLHRRFRLAAPPHLPVEEAFLRAIARYTPVPYAGYTAIFRTEDSDLYSPDGTLGWKRVIKGDLEMCKVPGNHDNMLRHPQIDALVGSLDAVLHRARRKVESGDSLRSADVHAASGEWSDVKTQEPQTGAGGMLTEVRI